jgi:hypothetical protein
MMFEMIADQPAGSDILSGTNVRAALELAQGYVIENEGSGEEGRFMLSQFDP